MLIYLHTILAASIPKAKRKHVQWYSEKPARKEWEPKCVKRLAVLSRVSQVDHNPGAVISCSGETIFALKCVIICK